MQLALNVVVFALGFCSAALAITRPKESRVALLHAVNKVDYILSAIRALLKREHVLAGEIEDRSFIFTKEQVEQEYESDSWQRNAYEDLKATLLSKERPFPCVYATKGYRDNEHRYVFLASQNPNEARNLRLITKALHEYLNIASSLGPNTSLVIMAATPSQDDSSLSVEDYREQFWHMLKGLHIADPKQWPADMPTDTGSSRWTFCFDGIPLFPVALTPAHEMRASRQASNFTVAIQPKWVLDNLLATPEKRQVATNKVRTLLKNYDQVDISPDLTEYGQPGTSEARQLFLLDQNETAGCPIDDFDD